VQKICEKYAEKNMQLLVEETEDSWISLRVRLITLFAWSVFCFVSTILSLVVMASS
jgi:hypothetical protein